MWRPFRQWPLCVAVLLIATTSWSIEIVVDYTYDTFNFFDTQQKRDVIEAAAARYSRVINSSLGAVDPIIEIPCNGGSSMCPAPWRIGFSHPGTGETYELSTAASRANDPISEPASEYGFAGLEADRWILFVGGRPLDSAALGGTATGLNFTAFFDLMDGPLHRGTISNTPSNSTNDLPAWGGTIAFSSTTNWHFDTNTTAAFGEELVDFYSIAMHEIGHGLGLATSWNQWQQHVDGARFTGSNAVAALNADNDANVSYLNLESPADPHWQNANQESFIFLPGEPLLVGTVGSEPQDLLLDPTANFNSLVRRFELTNVDAAALIDLGWSIIEAESNPLDINGDLVVDVKDVDLACAAGQSLDSFFAELNSIQGDIDLDGAIQFSDFLVLSNNFGSMGSYSDGDITCDEFVTFADFLLLSDGFGTAALATNVPEPTGSGRTFAVFFFLAMGSILGRWRLVTV